MSNRYFISSHCVQEYEQHGMFRGCCSVGFRWQDMENTHLREHLQVLTCLLAILAPQLHLHQVSELKLCIEFSTLRFAACSTHVLQACLPCLDNMIANASAQAVQTTKRMWYDCLISAVCTLCCCRWRPTNQAAWCTRLIHWRLPMMC